MEEMEQRIEDLQKQLIEDRLPEPMTPLTNSRMVIEFVTKARQFSKDGAWQEAKKYYRRGMFSWWFVFVLYFGCSNSISVAIETG